MGKKLTVITGGSSGLGLAAARCLASETSLLLCARGEAGLTKAKEELESFGADVYTLSVDATNAQAVSECASYASSLGKVTNVIHTAGVSPANTAADKILKINMDGTIHVVQSFYPVLSPSGTLICFSSTAGYTFDTNSQLAQVKPVIEGMFENWEEQDFADRYLNLLTDTMHLPSEQLPGMAYCISKDFVRHFVYKNTWRFARKGCRILSVSPGSYLTPMHQALIDNQPQTAQGVMSGIPLQRWGHPYEMGKLIAFLCSPQAGYLTGVDILADGGCTFAQTVKQIP